MRRKQEINWLKVLAIVFATLFVVSAVLLAINMWERRQGRFAEEFFQDSDAPIWYNGREYVRKDGIETVLLLGIDKFEGTLTEGSYNNDRQADFITLLVVDNDSEKFSVLQLNRDTMTEMKLLGVAGEKVGTVTRQLALAHTAGDGREVSCNNVADAVSGLLLGASVDHYVSVTMDAVSEYTTLMGGVSLTVLDDFTGIDDTLVKGETVNLIGEQALTYVRTRKGLDDQTNENRMVRQRQFMEAAYEQTLDIIDEDEEFIVDAVLGLSEYTVSDYSAQRLQEMFEKLSSYEFSGSYAVDGEYKEGETFMEFYPDRDSLENVIIRLFYEAK
ncbi:MAG: LCP family protein [Clostridia bacterium]|nr:LCP family protein [Clostridia bacterium]